MADVVVVGAGPAALMLTVALGRAGLDTLVLGGRDVGWAPNYGVWVDEMAALGLGEFLGPSWEDAEVVLSEDVRFTLGRGYGRLAKRRLRQHLLDEAERLGVRVVWDQVVSVEHRADGSDVHDASGRRHRTRLVVDASGHDPVLVRRAGQGSLFQSAVGILGTLPRHPWSERCVTFMDWRPADAEALRDGPPSFLYVMPIAPGRVFVEETNLIHGPAVPFALLKDRLRRRLARHGLKFDEVEETELCLFPMNNPLPALGQRVVGFGGAASFVHPATGYSLGRSFRAAEPLANTIARGLRAGSAPADVARAAWRSLWSSSTLTQRELFLFGSRVVADLDHTETVAFFDAFYGLPPRLRDGYLAGDGSLGTVTSAMTATWLRVPAALRWRLTRSGLGLPGSMLQASLGWYGKAEEPGCP